MSEVSQHAPADEPVDDEGRSADALLQRLVAGSSTSSG